MTEEIKTEADAPAADAPAADPAPVLKPRRKKVAAPVIADARASRAAAPEPTHTLLYNASTAANGLCPGGSDVTCTTDEGERLEALGAAKKL